MKELENEIKSVKESIKKLEDDFWQQRMKYGMQSTAAIQSHNREVKGLEDYLKGLVVAKTFIEKEGK